MASKRRAAASDGRAATSDGAPPAQRQKMTSTHELDDMDVVETPADAVLRRIECHASIPTLLKLLRSMRPSPNATDAVCLCIFYEKAVMENGVLGSNVFPMGEDEGSFQAMQTKTQSGILLTSMCPEGSTFSRWYLRAEIRSGLEVGTAFECWVSPRALIDKLKSMGLSGIGTLVFGEDSLSVKSVPARGVSTNMTFRYVQETEDRLIFLQMEKFFSEQQNFIAAQVDAFSLGQILSAMSTENAAALASLRLQTLTGENNATVMALTLSVETEVWSIFNGYVADIAPNVTVIDFRVESVKRADAKAAQEMAGGMDVDEATTPEDIMRQAQAAMDEHVRISKLKTANVFIEQAQEGFELASSAGTSTAVLPGGCRYELLMDRMFSSSKLLPLFKDIIAETPRGLTLIFLERGLLLLTPMADGSWGMHVMMYRIQGTN